MTKKLTVNTLALGNLRTRKKQYTLMIIGIFLAMIFTSGVPFFVSCMNSSQEEARFRRQGKQDYIIVNAQNYDFAPAMNQGTIDGEIGYAHILSYGWNEKEDFSDGTMIGWLDDRAEELYYPQIIEGRLPEKEGEIIFEKNALSRMKIEAKVGEKVTLKTLTCNGAEFLSEEKEKTYTLVGIMSDKKSNIENFSDELCNYDFVVGELKKRGYIDVRKMLTLCFSKINEVRTWANYIKHKGGIEYLYLEPEPPFQIYVRPVEEGNVSSPFDIPPEDRFAIKNFKSPVEVDIDDKLLVMIDAHKALVKCLTGIIDEIDFDKYQIQFG